MVLDAATVQLLSNKFELPSTSQPERNPPSLGHQHHSSAVLVTATRPVKRPFHSNHTRPRAVDTSQRRPRPHTATIARRNTHHLNNLPALCNRSIFEIVSSNSFTFSCFSCVLHVFLFFKLCHFANCHVAASGGWAGCCCCASSRRPQPPTSKLNSRTTAT